MRNLIATEPTAPAADPNRHFRTDHLKGDLGGRAARGGAVTVVSQGLKFVIGMAATVVLARLLTPQDYGLIGMVSVIIGLVSLFKDMGLSAATIQRADINYEQVSTLFWVNVTLSGALALLVAAIAPGVAWFYGEPRLRWITTGLALSFIFGGLTVQHEALLRRQMRFAALSAIEITSIVVGMATAIFFARRGFGYWALVFSNWATAFVGAAGVWLACRWRPGWPSRYSGVRSMLSFGGNLTGFSLINYFARNLDNLLIGRVWGAQQLGFYSKAYQLLLLPIDQINTPITAVAVPALSRLDDSPERYRLAYLRLLEKVALLTMPCMAFMIAASDWIVRVVLGPQWMGVSRLFAVLGLVGLIQPICNTAGWLFITQGRAQDMFKWGFIGGAVAIASIVIGLPWGAFGVAASYSLTGLCVTPPLLFWFVGRKGPVRAADFYRAIAPTACATACALVASLAFRRLTEVHNPAAGIVATFFITAATTLAILIIIPAGKRSLRDLKPLFMMLTVRRKPA